MISAVILASQSIEKANEKQQLQLLSPYQLLEASIQPLLQIEVGEIVLVLGHDYHRVLNMLKNLPPHVKVVIHRKPERGPVSALEVGLQALPLEVEGVVVARGDQVSEVKVIKELQQTFEQEKLKSTNKKNIIVPLYRGKRGFPWIISADFRSALSHLDGNIALNAILKMYPKEVLSVSVDHLLEKEMLRSHEV